MPGESDPPLLSLRRAFLFIGLAAALWSATRVTRMLITGDLEPADSDPHGYAAIFALVLIPILLAALVTLARDALWRRPGPHGITPGVTLALSAPLAGHLAIATALTGLAIITTTLIHRFRR